MTKKDRKTLFIIIAFISLGIVIYIQYELRKRDKQKLQEFEKKFIEKYGNGNKVVLMELKKLAISFSETNPETVSNINRALTLHSEGHNEEAIKKLAVIIENKMKSKLSNDRNNWFLALSDYKRKHLGISIMINQFRTLNYFNEQQTNILRLIANIRNGESHKEGFRSTKNNHLICLKGCIDIIWNFAPKKEEIALSNVDFIEMSLESNEIKI